MNNEISIWLQTNLAELATDSFSAINFASNFRNDKNQWQVAVETLYRCMRSDLVIAIPSIEHSGLSIEEISAELSNSNPFNESEWDSISIWMTTYLESTMMCREIVAEHGLLNAEAALISSTGWEEAAKLENDVFPVNGLNSRAEALIFAKKMRDLAIKSRSKYKNSSSKIQLNLNFMKDIEGIFNINHVPYSEEPLFPVKAMQTDKP
ncbi:MULTISPECIES: hypothetical protein [Xanthomonas]|jgi:hypothetical protein|uniref:hypothetical protein n=1 Tax=Xanthomonas TaxID=338 RepID=UPI001055B0BC|nr:MULTISPECIES: hypothetical protein [Xanthomonas]MBB5866576.1 hypothetical protein [Xanthomonas sp. 3058]